MNNKQRYFFISFNYKYNLGDRTGNIGLVRNDLPSNEEIKDIAYEKYNKIHKGMHDIIVLSIHEFKDKQEYDKFWGN